MVKIYRPGFVDQSEILDYVPLGKAGVRRSRLRLQTSLTRWRKIASIWTS